MMKYKKKMLGLQLFMFMEILVMLYYGFSTADGRLNRENAQRAKETVQKAVLECYSIEGVYPQLLEYLGQRYGLYIQEDAYRIHCHHIEANITPGTDVYPRSEQP